jgi:hypothetical protein
VLARIVDALLKHGAAYVARGQAAYEAEYQDRQVRPLRKRARDLGYDLRERPAAETESANQA